MDELTDALLDFHSMRTSSDPLSGASSGPQVFSWEGTQQGTNNISAKRRISASGSFDNNAGDEYGLNSMTKYHSHSENQLLTSSAIHNRGPTTKKRCSAAGGGDFASSSQATSHEDFFDTGDSQNGGDCPPSLDSSSPFLSTKRLLSKASARLLFPSKLKTDQPQEQEETLLTDSPDGSDEQYLDNTVVDILIRPQDHVDRSVCFSLTQTPNTSSLREILSRKAKRFPSSRHSMDYVWRFIVSGFRRLFVANVQRGPTRYYMPGYDISRIEYLTGEAASSAKESVTETNQRTGWLREVSNTWALRISSSLQWIDDSNKVVNHKFSALTFLPINLYLQFQFFFNLFYLIVGLSQLIPQFQIGPLFTYLAPLACVLTMTLTKEAIDDVKRRRRDKEINSQMYEVLRPLPKSDLDIMGSASVLLHDSDDEVISDWIESQNIRPGHILRLQEGDRTPCDMLFIRDLRRRTDAPSSVTGTTFLNTTQLDGETDWKLRKAVHVFHNSGSIDSLLSLKAYIEVEEPKADIYQFAGKVTIMNPSETEGIVNESVSLENTLWTNTLITSGPILALAMFTGKQTRAALQSTSSRTKTAKCDREVNEISKLLFFVLVLCSILLVLASQNIGSYSIIYFVRFVLILSSIIPISLRINLDMAKVLYSYWIASDKAIPDTVVRNSNIPEDLGCVDFLFSDKTGTITKNIMEFQKMSIGGNVLAAATDQQRLILKHEILNEAQRRKDCTVVPSTVRRKSYVTALYDLVMAIALTHSVTPIRCATESGSEKCSYMASSPDELALVEFAAAVGIELVQRNDTSMTVQIKDSLKSFQIIRIFPFSSVTKRMSILVRDVDSGQIYFYIKGADSAILPKLMTKKGSASAGPIPTSSAYVRPGSVNWVAEDSLDLARQGLRTLVYASKKMQEDVLESFEQQYTAAETSLTNRAELCSNVLETYLETDLLPLGVTGVEDHLQAEVPETIETLLQAGISVWMLTGDKVETALCIAASAGMKSRNDSIITLSESEFSKSDVISFLSRLQPPTQIGKRRRPNTSGIGFMKQQFNNSFSIRDPNSQGYRSQHQLSVGGSISSTTPPAIFSEYSFADLEVTILCVDGVVLGWCLDDESLADMFMKVATNAKSVICCRCSPTQKSQIVELVRVFCPNSTLAAIGDGGNDVPMIKAADCGIGIQGSEGKQASLASDFAISEFRYVSRLLLWHGRGSLFRSSNLALFVIHRGLLIGVIQVILSSILYFTPIALFQGWLQIGYCTYYTMFPVFSLVLDLDISESVTFAFPELYQSVKQSYSLKALSFYEVLFKAIFQGAAIMVGELFLFEKQLTTFVAITFTALILSELLNITTEVVTWHWAMVVSEIFSFLVYFASIFLLKEYFDPYVIMSVDFWWKVTVLTFASWLPPHVYKLLRTYVRPPQYAKLMEK